MVGLGHISSMKLMKKKLKQKKRGRRKMKT